MQSKQSHWKSVQLLFYILAIAVLYFKEKYTIEAILIKLNTVAAHMLVTAHKNYSMIYAYAVSFIECIDTHN